MQILESRGVHGISEHGPLNRANMPLPNSNDIGADNFQAQSLKCSIDHLREEVCIVL